MPLQKQLTVLDGVLRFISSALNIKVPTSSVIIKLSNEVPIIGGYEHYKSIISERLYCLLESEFIKPSKDLAYSNNIGRLAINLVLNEGITDQKTLVKLLSSQCYWYRNDDAFYFQVNDNRQFIGQETVLLLSQQWMSFSNQNTCTSREILVSVNNFLKFKGLLNNDERISFKDLNTAFKIEHAYSVNPNALLMIGNRKYSKQVSHESFIRLLTNKKVEVDKVEYNDSAGYKKWTGIWNTKKSDQQFELDADPIELGLAKVNELLAKLTGKKTALLLNRTTTIKSIKNWLEDNVNIQLHPATWLVICWLEKLINEGNIRGELGIGSIKDYVETVSNYFIPIFAELNLSDLSLDEWADNLNQMITLFPSVGRQKYARYFILFLVDSEFLPIQILERIEIDGDPMSISANLISLEHSEIILDHLAKLDSTTSNVARLAFCFGMFGGNRRGEVKHLQLEDVTLGDNYANERIYSRKGEKLKSSNANRNVALDVLWPKSELNLLAKYIDERTLATENNKAKLFESNELRKL